jgi:hypothetical protein
LYNYSLKANWSELDGGLDNIISNKSSNIPLILSKSKDQLLMEKLAPSDTETAATRLFIEGMQFHFSETVDGVVSPVEVNGRSIQPYTHSYKRISQERVLTAQENENISLTSIIPEMQLEIALAVEMGNKKEWKQITSAKEGRYQSEALLESNNRVMLLSELNPTKLTRALDAAGLLALNDSPIVFSEIKSHNNIKYSGKGINDIETLSNTIGAEASASATLTIANNPLISIKRMFGKKDIQYANSEFFYNRNFTKDSESDSKSGIFVTTDSLLYPTFKKATIDSELDYGLKSQSSGVADISYDKSQMPETNKQQSASQGRTRYVGDFDITVKMHMDSRLDLIRDEDDWLPCCSDGFKDMNSLDKKDLKSTAGIFDCTCFEPARLAQSPRSS